MSVSGCNILPLCGRPVVACLPGGRDSRILTPRPTRCFMEVFGETFQTGVRDFPSSVNRAVPMDDDLSSETKIVTTPDGRQLGVCLWGDPKGAPIFWLHGTPGSRMLRDPTDYYKNYRLAVCTYDRPGYGLSTRRPRYTQAQTVDDVVVIANALGWDRFAVAGASGGSAPALAASRFLADRVTRCAVVVGVGPSTTPELQQAMDEEDRLDWELAARGDETELAAQFADVLEWFDAGMPGVDHEDEAERRMLGEVLAEARRQGPSGYIDDCFADTHPWGFAVEDIRVPTRIMGGRDDTPFMRENSRWLAEHIPTAKLLWRPGGHLKPSGDVAEAQLFAWLGHGVEPAQV